MRFALAPLLILLAGCGPRIEAGAEPWRLCITSASIDPRVRAPRVAAVLSDPSGEILVQAEPAEGPAPVWTDACVARTAAELARGVRLAFWQVRDMDMRLLWTTMLCFPEPAPLFRQEMIDDGVDYYHLSLQRGVSWEP